MDTIVTIVAWAVIVLTAILLAVRMVRPKGPSEDVRENIAGLVGMAASVLLAGRALGWW